LRAVPNPAVAGRPVRFETAGSEAGEMRLRIHDAGGRLVRTVERSLRWDGLSESGRAAPAGVHAVTVERDGRPAGTTKLTLLR
jgi:hypothetical protein